MLVFFFEKDNGDKIWIQFKFERLAIFCYRCRMIDHVMGMCSFDKLAMEITVDGIISRVYGP